MNYPEIVKKLRPLLDAGLVSGLGEPVPGEMCVEAAVCFALGEPHGDHPPCVDNNYLRHLVVGLNDSGWSSRKARADGMRRLAIAQLGTVGMGEAIRSRGDEMLIRRLVPRALRSAASVNLEHAASLEAAAVRCEQEGTAGAATGAARAAWAATGAANAATGAAWAANAAARAARAATGAAWAAWAAADAADAADAAWVASSAADNAAYDQSLSLFCEDVVQILISLETPGSKLL